MIYLQYIYIYIYIYNTYYYYYYSISVIYLTLANINLKTLIYLKLECIFFYYNLNPFNVISPFLISHILMLYKMLN